MGIGSMFKRYRPLLFLFMLETCQGLNFVKVPGEIKMSHVSVGLSGVWGVSTRGRVYYRVGTYGTPGSQGSDWIEVGCGFLQVDVGTNVVWGVHDDNRVVVRTGIMGGRPEGGGWKNVDGHTMKHVSVSLAGHVWAVGSDGQIYHRIHASLGNPLGTGWEKVESAGNMYQVSVGNAGVWATNNNGEIYYRQDTRGDLDTMGSRWTIPEGLLHKSISSGDIVIGSNYINEVFSRLGLSSQHPSGTSWGRASNVPLKQIDNFGFDVWAVNDDNDTYYALE